MGDRILAMTIAHTTCIVSSAGFGQLVYGQRTVRVDLHLWVDIGTAGVFAGIVDGYPWLWQSVAKILMEKMKIWWSWMSVIIIFH